LLDEAGECPAAIAVHVIVDLQEQLALVIRLIDPVVRPDDERPVVEDAEQAVGVRAGQRELRIIVDVGPPVRPV